ncbi:hypothetical protein DM50_4092 [Burkholderia mallei]|nr:hypothetical protein DM50_4092 [Burkholderia mallei]
MNPLAFPAKCNYYGYTLSSRRRTNACRRR